MSASESGTGATGDFNHGEVKVMHGARVYGTVCNMHWGAKGRRTEFRQHFQSVSLEVMVSWWSEAEASCLLEQEVSSPAVG